jgi:hypothetical protein
MKFAKLMVVSAIGLMFVNVNPTIALSQGNGHGKGHNKDDDDEQSERYYKHHEEEARDWYYQNERHLPPGLAKKDRLSPGLEKQLVRRGTLPPGLQKRIQPCPEELVRRLPPPPPDCTNVLIGGHVVLLNHKTNIVVDVFHFEVN